MDISAEIAAIQAASQGSELRQPLVGALNKLNSGTLPAVTSSDTGKILKVGANGWEVGEKSGYMPVPSASLNISSNGTHDVTNYAEAVVNVQPSGKITITQNGTDIDVANYALADVAISGGATLVQKTITQNGTYDPADDNADGYSEVIVNTPASFSSLNYINFTATNASQIIELPFLENANYEILLDFELNNTNFQSLLATNGGATNTGITVFSNKYYIGTGSVETHFSASFSGRHTIILNRNGSVYFDSVEKLSNLTFASSDKYYWLGARGDDWRSFSKSLTNAKIYELKITDQTNNTVICDLVPKILKWGNTEIANVFHDVVNDVVYVKK